MLFSILSSSGSSEIAKKSNLMEYVRGEKTVVYFCKWSFFPRNYQKTYQIVSDFSKLCLIPLVEETVSGINATLLNRFTTSGKGFLLGLM